MQTAAVAIVTQDMVEHGMGIPVAHNSQGSYSVEADNSLPVRLIDGRVRGLLTGDGEAPCEAEGCRTSKNRSEALHVGHPGSEAAASPDAQRPRTF